MPERLLEVIKEQLAGCSDAVYQSIQVHEHSCLLMYIPSIVDTRSLQENITAALKAEAIAEINWPVFMERLDQGSAFPIPYIKAYEPHIAADLIVAGNVLLCIDELPFVYYFEISQYQKRGVSQSQNELVVIGPQEAFIEDIESNLSLLRHRIKHPNLKTKHYTIGKYTKTDVYVVYNEACISRKF